MSSGFFRHIQRERGASKDAMRMRVPELEELVFKIKETKFRCPCLCPFIELRDSSTVGYFNVVEDKCCQ